MAKLIVLLTLICLQVSRLNASPVAEEREATFEPVQNTEVTTNPDGEQNKGWTEQDKSWLQQLVQLLDNNDKEWTEKENKQLKDIVQKWFTEIENWFEDDDDDDDEDWWGDSEEWWDDSEDWSDEEDYFDYSGLSGQEEENINVTVDGSNDINMESSTVGLSNKFKRFSSI